MDSRFAAGMVAGLTAVAMVAGLPDRSLAQSYPSGQSTYTPPPPGYESNYSRPYDRPSSGIKGEDLPPPGGPPAQQPVQGVQTGGTGAAGNYQQGNYQQGGGYQQGGNYQQSGNYQGGYQQGGNYQGGYQQGGNYQGGYQEGAAEPIGRGYSYGNWEPIRPGAAPQGDSEYAARPPMEITPPGGGGYSPSTGYAPSTAYAPSAGYPQTAPSIAPPGTVAGLPPEDQPETGQPKELPANFRRQMVDYPSNEPPGTIIIDTPNTYLYLVLGGGKAMRYGIGVGRDGFTWSGTQKISRMAQWPDWNPPKEMIDRQPYLPRFMAGGESNPLGARAMYLGATVYRIHGTNQPSTIGSFVSSGCIRLTNPDVEDLYSRVTVGTKVVVMPGGGPHTAGVVAH